MAAQLTENPPLSLGRTCEYNEIIMLRLCYRRLYQDRLEGDSPDCFEEVSLYVWKGHMTRTLSL